MANMYMDQTGKFYAAASANNANDCWMKHAPSDTIAALPAAASAVDGAATKKLVVAARTSAGTIPLTHLNSAYF